MATKEHKIKSVKLSTAEIWRTYSIDCLDLADTLHKSENYSVYKADNASVHSS